MQFDILTIFPSLFDSHLNESIIKRAKDKNLIAVNIINIRDFATDKHSTTDDRPFGGGEGMVMKAEPLAASLESVEKITIPPRIILLSPQGKRFTQSVAEEISQLEQVILICGRYEGIDERFCSTYVTDELSIGDYILTGGELAAMIVIDAVTRLLPGVLGCQASADNDTFSNNLLKHPQYTRPRVFEGKEVPDVLLKGDHKLIEEYRFIESVKRTLNRRPELIQQKKFTSKETHLLEKHGIRGLVIKKKNDRSK